MYSDFIDAIARCGNADLVPGLIQAANGPCIRYRSENLVDLYLLARKLGGRIPVSADQAVKIASDLPFEDEALRVIDDFAKDIPNWPSGRRCAFFWFYGIRVEDVKGKAKALPYFAASVLANPSQDTAAWSKFPGTTPSSSEASKFARKYPLPEPFNPPSPKKWWHF